MSQATDVVYEVKYDGGLKAHGVFEVSLTQHEDYALRDTTLPSRVIDQILNQHSGIYINVHGSLYPGPPITNNPPTLHPMTVEVCRKGSNVWIPLVSQHGPWEYALDEELDRVSLIGDEPRGVRS